MKKQTVSYPLRLPASLKAAVAEISTEDGTNINQFVTAAVAENISVMKTAEFFTSRRAKADIKAARRILRRKCGQPPEPEDRLRGTRHSHISNYCFRSATVMAC